MNNESFLNKWNNLKLTKAKKAFRNKFPLNKKSIEFLFDIGLPNDVLYLSFDYLTKDLKTVNTAYKINNSYFNKYVLIGNNGTGDPIGINIENGEIVYLNHDDDLNEVYINADIEKFARCAIVILDFQDNLKKINSNSFFSTEFSDEDLTALQNNLTKIDHKVFELDSHWNHIVESWIWERQEERKKY